MRDLVELALRTAGETQPGAWPLREIEPSPGGRALDAPASFDEGLHLGTQTALAHTQADAVVSLSRIGSQENRETRLRRFGGGNHPARHVEYWIVDSDDPSTHNDLAAALNDAADTVAELRAEGHTVFLHCVHAHHRTPSVALLYAVEHCGLTADDAAEQIRATLGVDHIDGLLWNTAMHMAQRITAHRKP
ncbi:MULTISPECIES: dual specificity protein phosphatase family protein [Dermacoccus]|uniref:Tyrosine specific protein phosphatases domain-containing protein n=1 Tax=Dermacoccus profundi TaxID=322602 RepID=A0ABP4P7U9_9MICO|nr:dual specificity protein phosphatase family protein [Dermacoccus abyssi]